MKPHEKLGPIGRQLCWLFDAWIIGGGVDYISNENNSLKPKDIDIVIPLDRWVQASKLIPKFAQANSFGGFKFEDFGLIVDVWADDIARLSFDNPSFQAYQPKYRVTLGVVKREY